MLLPSGAHVAPLTSAPLGVSIVRIAPVFGSISVRQTLPRVVTARLRLALGQISTPPRRAYSLTTASIDGSASLSVLRRYRLSGLGLVNVTLLRGAVTMRSTMAGGLTYVSLARTSCGFHPCCATLFCAPSGKATTTARPATTRHGGDERVIAYSSGERDFWGRLQPRYTMASRGPLWRDGRGKPRPAASGVGMAG